jgi:hypothetical protein
LRGRLSFNPSAMRAFAVLLVAWLGVACGGKLAKDPEGYDWRACLPGNDDCGR